MITINAIILGTKTSSMQFCFSNTAGTVYRRVTNHYVMICRSARFLIWSNKIVHHFIFLVLHILYFLIFRVLIANSEQELKLKFWVKPVFIFFHKEIKNSEIPSPRISAADRGTNNQFISKSVEQWFSTWDTCT